MGEVFLWNTPSNRWVTIRSFPVLGGDNDTRCNYLYTH